MARSRGSHISLEAVSHRYRGARADAIEAVSLAVEPGEAVALLGRSGCGKSTLLHIISGLVTPSAGRVRIDGRLVEGPSPSLVVMFQQPSLYPWMTVAQNVGLGLRFLGRRKEIKQVVPEMLALVELSDFADRNVQSLSGGQQQRVALARSLAPRPEALLLDEPFSSLDAFTRASLQRDVRRIAKTLGITLVVVTHDINEAVLMADRALVMKANPGRICDDVRIDLGDRSDLRGNALSHARAALVASYERAAGISVEMMESGNEPSASATADRLARGAATA